MGGGKDLKEDQIAAITSLSLVGKSNKEISIISGVSLRSVQRWTKKKREAGDADVPLHKKRPGRPRKNSQRTLKLLQRQVEQEP